MNRTVALRSNQNFPVLGLPVHCMDNYLDWLLSRLQAGLGTHVVTLNAEMAMEGEQNDLLGKVIRSAELVIPDGAGVILYLRLKGVFQKRCPGIELAESLLQEASVWDNEDTIFFYGGKPGVAMAAAAAWQQQIRGGAIASQHGYISPAEETELLQTLAEVQPRLIFVGLGAPRQELWIAQHRHICPQAIWIGVGGSFDIWAGEKKRAPAWFGDNHLEWLYRLYQEPWRWRRMLVLPKFALRAIIDVKL